MEFGVSMLLRPEVERNGSEFVDQRVGQAVFGEVDGFDVGLASVAAFDADVGKLLGGVDGKLSVVFLAASGADDAAELPFGQAEPAEQAAAAAVALLAQDAVGRFAIAERAQRMGVTVKLQAGLGARELGGGLKKCQHQEFLGISGRVDIVPALGEEVSPGVGVGIAQVVRYLGEAGGAMLFCEREELREGG